MTFRDQLDLTHALWADDIGREEVAQRLHDVSLPPDEGDAAQANLDAMLAR